MKPAYSLLRQIPGDMDQRWRVLRNFITEWHSPLSPEDGTSDQELDAAERRLGLKLPRALREWHRIAGRRADVWSTQDLLLPPDQLGVYDSYLAIYQENQSVAAWCIRLDELAADDPAVWLDRESGSARGEYFENRALSEFALQMCVLATKFAPSLPCSANGYANERALRIVEKNYPRLGFPDWHWPGAPTRFFASDDVIIETHGEGADGWIWASAKNEAALLELEALLAETGTEWEYRLP